MIKLKINMNDGTAYRIRNLSALTIKDFIKTVLMPAGVELIWYQVIPGEYIRVSSISSITEILEEFVVPFSEEDEDELESGELVKLSEEIEKEMELGEPLKE